MTEQPNDPPEQESGVEAPTTEKSSVDEVSISRADLEALRGKGERMDKLDETAKEFECETAEEMNELLEEAARKELLDEPVETPPKSDPPPVIPPEKGNGDMAKLQQELASVKQMAAQTFLASQWGQYQNDLKELPADQRPAVDQAALTKLIYGNQGPLVQQVSKEFGGNVYAAANHILTATQTAKKSREAGAASEKAKANAAASSPLGLAGTIAEPTTTTPAEKRAAMEKQAASAIAPDEVEWEVPKR